MLNNPGQILRNKFDKIFAHTLQLAAALVICRTFPALSFFYYAAPVIFILTLALHFNPHLILNLKTDKSLRTIIVLLLMFGVWAALTAAWSTFPIVSILRAGYFLLISIASLLLGYHWAKKTSSNYFAFLLPANMIVVLVSFFSLITSSPGDSWSGGHGLGFKGFASHQNTLASAIIFTIPSVLYPILKEVLEKIRHKTTVIVRNSKPGTNKSILLFYLPLSLVNLYLLAVTVSRAALITLIIFLIVFIILNFKWNTSLAALFLLIFVLLISFYTVPAVKNFIYKTESNIGDRRAINITATIEAARSGGLIGIGYGISQPLADKRVIGRYEDDGKRFVREKMIGVLAIIEETGIIGIGLFLAPIFFIVMSLYSRLKRTIFENRMHLSFLISVVIAFCFHAQIEAWWVGVGSIELPLFFTLLGAATYKFLIIEVISEDST